MPSVSKSQQRLMGAAEHGADFPMADKLRQTMSHDQLHDFAIGSMLDKPEHVQPLISGDNAPVNKKTFMNRGMNEFDATKESIRKAQPYRGQHKNLGKFLHNRKDGMPHGTAKD